MKANHKKSPPPRYFLILRDSSASSKSRIVGKLALNSPIAFDYDLLRPSAPGVDYLVPV